MLPQISLTYLLEQSMAISSSQGNTTKPYRLQGRPLFMASCKFLVTIPICTLSITPKIAPWPPHSLLMWTNHLQSETPRCRWPHSQSQTSFNHPNLRHCMSCTQAHHSPTLTTIHIRRPPKLSKNWKSYPKMTSFTMSRALCQYIPRPSQGSEKEWWKPHSIDTTFALTTQSFSSYVGITAFSTRIHSERERTHTLGESSPIKRPTLSTLGRCLLSWSISPSRKNMMRPCAPRCNASDMPTTGSEIWLKTWPISKNYTTIYNGRNKTPCTLSPAQTSSADWSRVSSMMPRQVQTFLDPCLMLGSTTS
jgi:hypothetical protein